jgi:hypothetical protein
MGRWSVVSGEGVKGVIEADCEALVVVVLLPLKILSF